MRLALLVVLLSACANVVRPTPKHESDIVWAAVELDERAEARAALAAWLDVLHKGDEAAQRLAIARLDALITEGVTTHDTVASLRDHDVPQSLRPALHRLLARAARLRGDEPAARNAEHAAGCGQPWQGGAPLGRLAHLDVAQPLDDAVFVRADRSTTRMRGCRVLLMTADGRPGAVPLGVELDAAIATTARLTLDTDEPYRVWLDGVATPVPDQHEPLSHRRTLRIDVPAGKHRLAVVVALPFGRTELGVELEPGSAKVSAANGHHYDARNGKVELTAVTPAAHDALGLYLDAARALADGDGVRARSDAAQLVVSLPKSAAALALAARIAAQDGTVPVRIAKDRGRRLLERALALEPRAVRVREALGRLALERDRPRDALELAQAPDLHNAQAALLYADTLRARNRDPEVRAVLDAARDEGQCVLVDAFVTDDKLRHRPLDLARSERQARCRPGSPAWADALSQLGDRDRALVEYRRVIAVDPIGESARSSLAELLVERGQLDDAVHVLRDLLETSRRSSTYRLRLVDTLLAAGHTDEADRTLREGIALDPESAELAAAERARGDHGDRPYAEDRIDGRAAIAAFEAEHRVYDGPAVFVLDRTVSRVYPTGGQRTLTHNIVKVLTKDGIDRWGEWTLPEGAELLALCAWKPDGARLEPEEIAEKDSVSLPGLAAGDYVEIEYVERAGPPAAFGGGFLGERFFFGSFEAPLDRSEYFVITPHGMPVDIDRRDEPPKMTLTSRDEPSGRVDVRAFAGKNYPQRIAEPSAAPGAEYLASVRVSSRVSTAAWRDYLRDLSWGTRRRDPELDAVARAQTNGAHSDRERLDRLDRWVRRTIKQGGGIEDQATAILARREGHRATLLCALAEAIGLPARLLLARSRRSAQIDELEGYDQLLAEIAGFVDDVRTRHGRPDELQPHLRGALALPIDDGRAVTITLPDHSTDARALSVTMQLAADGSGDVTVAETLTGWPAVEWRDALETLAPDRVRAQFEQHSLSAFFPGGTLHTLDWQHADDDDQPFVVRYTLAAPGLAHRTGGALVLGVPFAAELLSRYATGQPRRSPLLLDEVSSTTLDLRVALFPGAIAQPYPAVKLDTPFAQFAQEATVANGTLHLRSRFFLPLQRRTPSETAAFLSWAAEVDRAEKAAARITR